MEDKLFQEGIKTYATKLAKTLKASGKLKKNGLTYLGNFSQLNQHSPLDDQQYSKLRMVKPEHSVSFFSKPGVFGWDKIDQGTVLLLEGLIGIFKDLTPQPKTALDLGCGYGWVALNIDGYNFESITATDNNIAALISAEANAKLMNTPLKVVASNCANHFTEKFDLVLCNPPFHKGFKHSQELTEQFLLACSKRLKPKGFGLFVVNEFIPLEKLSAKLFSQRKVLVQERGFKVILLEK